MENLWPVLMCFLIWCFLKMKKLILSKMVKRSILFLSMVPFINQPDVEAEFGHSAMNLTRLSKCFLYNVTTAVCWNFVFCTLKFYTVNIRGSGFISNVAYFLDIWKRFFIWPSHQVPIAYLNLNWSNLVKHPHCLMIKNVTEDQNTTI